MNCTWSSLPCNKLIFSVLLTRRGKGDEKSVLEFILSTVSILNAMKLNLRDKYSRIFWLVVRVQETGNVMSGVSNNHILLLAECYVGNLGVLHLVKQLIFCLLYSVKIGNYIHAVVLFVNKVSVFRFSWKLLLLFGLVLSSNL